MSVVPLRLAENFRAAFYAPFYATLALGFYADEGVEIELVNSAIPGDGVAGLLDGSVDVTWGGPMRVMKAREQNPDSTLVCFGEVVGRDPFYLVGIERPYFQLSDLPSLRFAAVSEVPTPWMCLQHDLRLLSVDPSRLRRAAARTMRDNLEALRSRQIDVAQLFEPFVSMAARGRIGDVLYAASTRGPTVYTTFIATRDRIARRRADFAGMVRATQRTQDWLAAHDAAELAEVAAPFYPDIEFDLLLGSLQRCREAGIWAQTPQVSRPGFTRLAESLVSGGFISRPPRYEDCVEGTL